VDDKERHRGERRLHTLTDTMRAEEDERERGSIKSSPDVDLGNKTKEVGGLGLGHAEEGSDSHWLMLGLADWRVVQCGGRLGGRW